MAIDLEDTFFHAATTLAASWLCLPRPPPGCYPLGSPSLQGCSQGVWLQPLCLSSQGLKIFSNLDDWLLCEPPLAQVIRETAHLLRDVAQLGLKVNELPGDVSVPSSGDCHHICLPLRMGCNRKLLLEVKKEFNYMNGPPA